MTTHHHFSKDFPLLDLHRVAGHIGAEIRNITLTPALDEGTFAQLNAALLKHKVLFFRGQHHLTDASHQAFGERFGRIWRRRRSSRVHSRSADHGPRTTDGPRTKTQGPRTK